MEEGGWAREQGGMINSSTNETLQAAAICTYCVCQREYTLKRGKNQPCGELLCECVYVCVFVCVCVCVCMRTCVRVLPCVCVVR